MHVHTHTHTHLTHTHTSDTMHLPLWLLWHSGAESTTSGVCVGGSGWGCIGGGCGCEDGQDMGICGGGITSIDCANAALVLLTWAHNAAAHTADTRT